MAEYDENYDGDYDDAIDENFDVPIDMRDPRVISRDRNMRAQAKGGGVKQKVVPTGKSVGPSNIVIPTAHTITGLAALYCVLTRLRHPMVRRLHPGAKG